MSEAVLMPEPEVPYDGALTLIDASTAGCIVRTGLPPDPGVWLTIDTTNGTVWLNLNLNIDQLRSMPRWSLIAARELIDRVLAEHKDNS